MRGTLNMDIFDQQKYIFGSLFLLANKMQVVGDQHLGKEGMTTKQWFLTVMVSQFGDNSRTLSEVAELMGSSRQNVKQLALKLEEKDFLRLEKDEQDARAVRLKLTEKSKAFWEKRRNQDNQFIRELFQDLSKDEIDILQNCLDKLFANIIEIGKAL